jgi:hypothetical protein
MGLRRGLTITRQKKARNPITFACPLPVVFWTGAGLGRASAFGLGYSQNPAFAKVDFSS